MSSVTSAQYIKLSIQKPLTQWQGRSLMGPCVISPIKIVVGTVQTIGALALSILTCLCSVLACIGSSCEYDGKKSEEMLTEFAPNIPDGLRSVASGMLNMVTLGLVPNGIEDF